MIVIAHRGASGYVPEHTLAAYAIAIEQGADYIEPDLVATKDGVLVARHENAIALMGADGRVKEATTDVAQRPEFASRRRVQRIDGVALDGWFTEDFTLAELKTLRAIERLPALRPANTRYDGMFEVPTFDEVLQLLVQAHARRSAAAAARGLPPPRPIGIYPETKHPSHFRALGLPLEPPLLAALQRHGLAAAGSPVFLQSFEVGNLRALRPLTPLPLVQLLAAGGRPWDFVLGGDPRGTAELATPQGLAEIASYADAIGPQAELLIPRQGDGLGAPTPLVADAHRAGLQVHPWTFRAENAFLPPALRQGADPAAHGLLARYLDAFFALGIDGFFADHAFLARQARDACLARGGSGAA